MAYNRKLLYTKSFPSWNTPEGNLGSITVGSAMTPIQLVATEINEPGSTITYAVTTGNLPTGLTLSSSGEISGTPTGYTSTETINFTITATDNEGETAFRNFNIIVSAEYSFDSLVIAGGGGAGKDRGGGGGAGGYKYNTALSATIGSVYSITVGSGGTGTSSYNVPGGSGANSVLSGPSLSITSIGGGGGGGGVANGLSGGSGGGAGNGSYPGSGTSGQGFAGGALPTSGTNSCANTGGGGGASQVGKSPVFGSFSGNGGDGLQNSITGTPTYYAGGGGGGGSCGAGGLGGQGGGGNGCSNNFSCTGGSGSPNTGGGGGGNGGGGGGRGGHGGSGVVILRMPTSNYSGTTTGSPTVTTDGSDTILTYTGSGTYTA